MECFSFTLKGSAKLKENLKPNEKPTEVDAKVQDNIRQVKTVAGERLQPVPYRTSKCNAF